MCQLGFDHGELLNEVKTNHQRDLQNAADLHDQAMAAAQAELASEKARHDKEMAAIRVAALLILHHLYLEQLLAAHLASIHLFFGG